MAYDLPPIRWHESELEGELPAPEITITARGCHDVGRLIECLARGNSEQAHLARNLVDRMKRSRAGRATLRYLQGHGGGKWFVVRSRKNA